MEDSTDFAIIGWDAGWSVVTVYEEPIWTWVRDGGLDLYEWGAQRHLVTGHGEPPRVEDLRPAIRAAWPGGVPSGGPIIRAARQRGHDLLLAVSIYGRKPVPHHILASAVLHSTDDGRSFQPWAHVTGHEVELLDVIWLEPGATAT
jgi:hypothetical protein